MRHLLNPLDFSVEEIDQLLDLASDIEANPAKYAHVCDGKKIATLFYEPSTRTRLSFEAAMLYEPENYVGDVKVLYCDNEKFTFLPLDNIDNEKFWKNATLGDIKLQKIKC